MSFPRYSEYQDSGSEWLGDIPKQWSAIPLKWAINQIESGTSVNAYDLPRETGNYGILKTSCVYKGWFDWRENKTVVEEDLTRVSCPLKRNTLIVSRMNTPELVGAAGLVEEAPGGIFLPDRLWQVSFLPQHSPHFFYYFTSSKEYRTQIKLACSGTSSSMQNLGQDDFRDVLFAAPSKFEQAKIARFLDHETAKIDALIREQERLLALLQEKRNSLALSPYDSEVWPEERLANVVQVINRPVFQMDGDEYIALGLYNRGRGLFHKEPKEKNDMGDSDFFWVESGDLILSGQFAWEGAVALAGDSEAGKVVSHRYPIIRGKTGVVLTEYLFALLTTSHGDYLLNENSRGAAGRNRPLNLSSLLKERIKIPPISLQESVAEVVLNIRSIRQEAENQKQLLLEHRAALISAAVTGKIDVRDWQPPAEESAFDGAVLQTGVEAIV